LTDSFKSAADETSVTPATVRAGHGYPADRIETSPEPTGWQGSGADDFAKQGASISIQSEAPDRANGQA